MADIIMIKQAAQSDIPIIEDILLDAVNHFDDVWSKERVSWERLSREFLADNFYIAYLDDNPAGCMALVDYDPFMWSDIEKGQALFVHKLAVKRSAAGQGISAALLEFAVNKCREKNIQTLRLDCNADKEKLMNVYENFGFTCVNRKIMNINNRDYNVAFFVYYVI